MKNKSVAQLIVTDLFIVLVLVASNSIARAQCLSTTNWNGGTGDWFTGTNWSNGVPDQYTCAYINNGEAQILGGPVHATAFSLVLGDNQGNSGGVVVDGDSATLDLGTSPCRGDIYIGNRGSGHLTINNGGTINCRHGYIAKVANPTKPTSTGSVKVKGSPSTWTVYDDDACPGAGLFIGAADVNGVGGTATLEVSDGGKIVVVRQNTVSDPAVVVGDSGTVTGNGAFYIDQGRPSSKLVKVFGTLKPSGVLQIKGNLVLDATRSTTVCGLTPENWDALSVSPDYQNLGGNAQLGGRLIATLNGTFPLPWSGLIVTSIGLGGSEFASLSTMGGGPCVTAALDYTAYNASINLSSSCGGLP